MRALFLLIKLILLGVLMFVGATFALYNEQLISVNFVVIETVKASLGIWLLLFLVVGTVLGIASSSFMLLRYQRQLARAKKSLSE